MIDWITAVLFKNREMNPTEFDHPQNKLKCLSFAFKMTLRRDEGQLDKGWALDYMGHGRGVM